MSNILEIKNATKTYGEVRAVDDLTLSIPEGSFFGLLGPNGAGKSTLINVIGGLTKADSGSAMFGDIDIRTNPYRALKKIGIVQQELSFDPFLNVIESLTFQSKYHGLHHNGDWIEYLLDRLHLADKRDTNTRSLSGGMKRRLMIAQSLVHRPSFIVLDEPTAGVDIQLRHSLWQFIRELNDQKHTILLTTHYLEEAERLCEYIALMYQGKIVAQNRTDEIIRLCQSTIQVEMQLSQPPAGAIATRLVQEDGCYTLQIDSYYDIIDVLAQLRSQGIEVVQMSIIEANLEDAFLDIIGKHASYS